jgi:ribonuclease HI
VVSLRVDRPLALREARLEVKSMATPKSFVRLITDGACSGNPGPGGWAYILEHPASGKVQEAAGAEKRTTNNRMELQAAIEGLRALKRPCKVELVTDSEYVGKGVMEWMPKWKAQGWIRKGKNAKPLMNIDLWQALDVELQPHDVNVTIVRGHAGHPENEAVDRMAVAAYQALAAEERDAG